MGKIDDYREQLKTLDDWDAFLLAESRLPGPRANLELAFATAGEGTDAQFLRLAALDPEQAPQNTPEEFLAFCGVLGLGYLAARGEGANFSLLRQKASDPRWRVREAVALGLQEYGRVAITLTALEDRHHFLADPEEVKESLEEEIDVRRNYAAMLENIDMLKTRFTIILQESLMSLEKKAAASLIRA